jgi:hypothetical protein
MAILKVSNLKDCMGLVIKFVKIKVNLIKKRLICLHKFKVHKVNVER